MAERRGLLLINLGSPKSAATGDVRRYLNQFLTDPHVIDLAAPWRQLLVRGIIAPLRAPKSARAYAKVWTPGGSPLVAFTRAFAEKLGARLAGEFDVRWAMRYGEPSIAARARDWDVRSVAVVPLYPQYAESSTRTALEEARRHLGARDVRTLEDFFDAGEFLSAEARAIQAHLDAEKPDHLLLSFHGLPEHHMTKLHPEHCFRTADCCERIDATNRFCYRAQCVATAKGLVARLRYPAERVTYGFQSRLGRRPWIKPYTDVVVDELVARGVRRLSVACPSFVADCLETLEEVELRLREQFRARGGEELKLIPALNAQDHWVEAFAGLVRRSF